MIVEDELIVSRSLEQRLNEEGFNVVATASSGEEAIELSRKVTPDLILMDIKLLGQLDGIQTATLIKRQQDIPIIYLSAYADDEIITKATLTDPFGYVLKPYEVRDLKMTIRIALYKHELERKLKQSEEKFRILFHHSPLGNVLFNAEGVVVDANTAFAEMFGYHVDELFQKNIWKLFAKSDKNEKNLPNLTGNILETEIVNKFDKKLWIRVSFSSIHFSHQSEKFNLAVVEDITLKKVGEKVLKESELRLRRMVENLPAGAVYIDDKTFYFNKEAEKITGYKADEIKNLDEWFIKLYPENYNEVKKLYLIDKKNNFQIPRTVEIIRKDKEKRFVEFIAHLFKNDEIWIVIDVTARLKAEEEIISSRDKLKKLSEHLQTAREEERAAIAREVHDDLGQSLTALKMELVWLKKNREAGDKIVSDKLNSMVEIVNQTIKTIQRLGTELRPKLLDDLGLISAIEWQASEFQKRFGIKCTFQPINDEINVDPKIGVSVFRILQEALTNVVRHANASEVKIAVKQLNGTFFLSISDNGVGIPVNQLESNSSIGIIGMKERADIAGGKVEFISQKGKGTEVRLTIPLHQEN